MQKQKVDVAGLEMGMYICELDSSWADNPFPSHGFIIRHKEELDEIRKNCNFVHIDILKSEIITKEIQDSPPEPIITDIEQDTGALDVPVKNSNRPATISFDKSPPAPSVSFEDEIQQAKSTHKKLRSVVDNLFLSAARDNHLDIAQAKEVVQQVVESINRNEYALGWMTQLKEKHRYTATHSMNVCILSVKLGRHVGLHQDDLNMLGMCGLMHDIGKLRVPNTILDKPGRLTESEMMIMKHHAGIGAALLKNTQGASEEVHSTALSHHEKIDGTGYPNLLPGGDINMFTRIVSIADIYDAVTSERVYHMGMSSSKGASLLYELRDHHLDTDLVESFIQCIGLYPVGTVVETQSGEVGIVVSSDARHRMNPSILMVLDQAKQRYKQPSIINTATAKDGSGKFKYNIKRSLDVGSYQVSPKDFFD